MSRTKVAIDFNISPRIVGALDSLYGHQGFEFLHLQQFVAGNTPDVVWADSYKRFGGRLVISGDTNIAYRPHEAIAFIDNELISFFPSESWSGLKMAAKSALLIYYWPLIAKKIESIDFGSCWKMPVFIQNGELRLKECDFSSLEIPNHVLDSAREKKGTS